MSVPIECICVVVPKAVLEAKYPGGLAQYRRDNFFPMDPTYREDEDLTRTAFMGPWDVKVFRERLEAAGLRFLDERGRCADFAVVDMNSGPTTPCDWLEFEKAAPRPLCRWKAADGSANARSRL